MAYNDIIVKKLRETFEPTPKDSKYYNSNCPFTNCALVFAYNGTGKTRLSYDFAHYERNEDAPKHTLYYNAYTEDLFTWDNDLENNMNHRLIINRESDLIRGLAGGTITLDIRKYLSVFNDIDFEIEYEDDIPAYVTFSKTVKQKSWQNGQMKGIESTVENIKISRGEERLFVWCFFRCIIDQVLGGNNAYKDIEYIYIDDPMSSLDDNNVIAFAQQLYTVIRKGLLTEKQADKDGKEGFRRIKFVISSHHALFFHTMLHGLNADKKLGRYYLCRDRQTDRLTLKNMSDDAPFYYNVAMMCEVKKAIEKDKLYTYHFTILRSVIEKIQEFFGHKGYESILAGIKYRGDIYENTTFSSEELTDFYARVVNVLTHQGAMFTPVEMNEDNKDLVKAIFNHLVEKYDFKLPNLDDYHSESYLASHSEM